MLQEENSLKLEAQTQSGTLSFYANKLGDKLAMNESIMIYL